MKSLSKFVPMKMRQPLKSGLRRITNIGLRHRCPLCSALLRDFKPFGLHYPVLSDKKVIGGGYRKDALCPVCDAIDRERLLYLYLKHRTDLFTRPTKLLHFAPESRLSAVLLKQQSIDYLTADLFSPTAMMKIDITDIPFPNDTFDVIICNHVLEHVIDDAKAMSELYRTMKPRGWGIFQVPISLVLNTTYEDFSITTPSARGEAFGQEDHVRLYARDYPQRLTAAGFIVEEFKWFRQPEKFGGQRNGYGLNPDEVVYVARKAPGVRNGSGLPASVRTT